MAAVHTLSFDDVSAIAAEVGYPVQNTPREEHDMPDTNPRHTPPEGRDPMVLLLASTLERQSEIFVDGFKDIRTEMHTSNRNQLVLNIVSMVLMFALVAGSVAVKWNTDGASFESHQNAENSRAPVP